MNVFIIGAGFTKAVFPDAPLNRNLLDALVQRSTDSAGVILRDKYETGDIEIALTRLDLDIVMSESECRRQAEDGKTLRSRVETELGDYFSSFVASEKLLAQAPWLAQLLNGAFSAGDVVISLNYDCVLEGALDCCGKWSPRGGYGASFDLPPVGDDQFSESPVTVLKIHGSASFVVAQCGDNPEASAVNFVLEERFFPRSGRNRHICYGAGTGRPYLIAPSYVKIPTMGMACLMLDALRASSTATNFVIIGSALRPEDVFLKVIITNFFRQPLRQKRRLFIVDPEASAIGSRIKNGLAADVWSQIVPIEAPLEDSAGSLIEEISK